MGAKCIISSMYISIHHPFNDVWLPLPRSFYSIALFNLGHFTWFCFGKPVLPNETAHHYKGEKQKEDHSQLCPFHFHLCSLVVSFSGRLKEKGQFHRHSLLNFTYRSHININIYLIFNINCKKNYIDNCNILYEHDETVKQHCVYYTKHWFQYYFLL